MPMKRLATMFILMAVVIGGLFIANQAFTLAKSSTSASDAMRTAGQLYDAGHFTEAAQSYQQVVDQGVVDSALYYNLGNAYFKQRDLGRAILNYRRAQRLAPRDADIAANLQRARDQVAAQISAANAPGNIVTSIETPGQNWLTLNELAVLALLTWIGFVVVVMIYTSSKSGSALRQRLRYGLAAVSLALLVSVAGLGSRLYREHTQTAGVIVAANIAVAASPGSQKAARFTLPGGAEVQLLETRGNWSQIALPNAEVRGWVPANAVKRVS